MFLLLYDFDLWNLFWLFSDVYFSFGGQVILTFNLENRGTVPRNLVIHIVEGRHNMNLFLLVFWMNPECSRKTRNRLRKSVTVIGVRNHIIRPNVSSVQRSRTAIREDMLNFRQRLRMEEL